MPTEALRRALERQKIGDAEADYVEVVARALQTTPTVVNRVLFAVYAVDQVLREMGLPAFFRTPPADSEWEKRISHPELREAVRRAIGVGVVRVRLARSILEGAEVLVDVESLIPAARASELCRGCPEQLECVASGLSTPDACFGGRKEKLWVKPVRLTRHQAEVEAQQPAGKHVIPLSRIKLFARRQP
jgi:hypothetical protein